MADFDVVVVGGGNAGQGAAYRTAGGGKKTALVDKGEVGGLCALRGCNPKKVMVRATEVLDEIRRAQVHGIEAGAPRIDWSKVIDRLHTFTDPIPQQTENALAKAGVTRLRGLAHFTAPDRMAVDGRELAAEHFVIATGSRPRRLAFPGAELVKITDDLFDLRTPPERMVIVGAGVVACEFGFVYARLGTQVTVLARGDRILGREFDRDFLRPVIEHGQKSGIRWEWNARVRAVRPGAVELEGGQTIAADLVLNAAGRTSAVEELELDRGRVKGGPDGIEVDQFLQSSTNPRVFAAGDAHGRWQLSPVASYEGRVISRNILSPRSHPADYDALPRAVFTTPPLAVVGLTEEEAARRGRTVKAVLNEMTGWKVFAIAGEEIALAKTIVEEPSGRVLGAQLMAPTAPDMIHLFALAIRFGMTRAQLEDMVYAYPTPTSALSSTFKKW